MSGCSQSGIEFATERDRPASSSLRIAFIPADFRRSATRHRLFVRFTLFRTAEWLSPDSRQPQQPQRTQFDSYIEITARQMLKLSSFYIDTADMKKLYRIAKRDGLKGSYLIRKAIKEFIEREEQKDRLERIATKNKLKTGSLVRAAIKEFIKQKEHANNPDWWMEFLNQPDALGPVLTKGSKKSRTRKRK
jgi:predicted transcriptional regulator